MKGFIEIDGIRINVSLRRTSRISIRLAPPDGAVHVSAPRTVPIAKLKEFVESKIDWIRDRRKKYEAPKSFQDGEVHYIWGEPCRLSVDLQADRPQIDMSGGVIRMAVPPKATPEYRRLLLEFLHKRLVWKECRPLVKKWEAKMGASVKSIRVVKMRSRWGSCRPTTGNISISSELAKKPPECLEYIVVHELAHFFEKGHNDKFYRIVGNHFPEWREAERILDDNRHNERRHAAGASQPAVAA